MAAHLAMRSGNPVLTADTFQRERPLAGDELMTIAGTVNKTALLFVILFMTATFTWSQGPAAGGYIIVGALGGLVVALATVLKKTWAPVTAPIYAAFGLMVTLVWLYLETLRLLGKLQQRR